MFITRSELLTMSGRQIYPFWGSYYGELIQTPLVSSYYSSSWSPLIPKCQLPNLTATSNSNFSKEFTYYNDGLIMNGSGFIVTYPEEEVIQKNVVVIE